MLTFTKFRCKRNQLYFIGEKNKDYSLLCTCSVVCACLHLAIKIQEINDGIWKYTLGGIEIEIEYKNKKFKTNTKINIRRKFDFIAYSLLRKKNLNEIFECAFGPNKIICRLVCL